MIINLFLFYKSTLFNFILLMVEFVFSYFIRRVEKTYKEVNLKIL